MAGRQFILHPVIHDPITCSFKACGYSFSASVEILVVNVTVTLRAFERQFLVVLVVFQYFSPNERYTSLFICSQLIGKVI